MRNRGIFPRGILRVRVCFMLAGVLYACGCALCLQEWEHPLQQSEREREKEREKEGQIEREIKRKRGRERKRGRGMKRERESRIVIFIFNRNEGCLGTF